MKVVIVGNGSTGDSLPLVSLAAELQRAGHEAVLLCDEDARAAAAAYGLNFRPLPGSMREVVIQQGATWDIATSGRAAAQLARYIGELEPEAWLDMVAEAARDADVVVASTLGVYHAASVCQDLRLPLVFAQLQPTLPTREYPPASSGMTAAPRWLNRPLASALTFVGDRTMRGGINRVRRSRGQAPLRVEWRKVPFLMAWSRVLLPAASDWVHPDFTITGQWHLDACADWKPSSELRAFLDSGEPPVYVGFGSMAGLRQSGPLRDAVLEGLSGRRVLLSAGWDVRGTGVLPPETLPIGAVPHDWLFPRCAAVVHHCGAGTSHSAARAGVPSIPVPFTADQPFWARRLYERGIAAAPLAAKHLSASVVAQALDEATTPAVTRRAHEIAALMREEPDWARATIAVLQRAAAA